MLRAELDEVARSSIWETAAVGPAQPDFLNGVVVAATVLGPRPLLARCLEIEAALGRVREERWGPRSIDLDLLLYGDATVDAPGLKVPHPEMSRRRFVLAPLAEVWPDAWIPGHGAVSDLLRSTAEQAAVRTEMEW